MYVKTKTNINIYKYSILLLIIDRIIDKYSENLTIELIF